MDARCRIQLLGGLRVRQGDRLITRFRTQKTGALLAHLAYHLQHPHPREVLIALLWPESELKAGQASLRKAVSSLRHQIEPPGVPNGAVIKSDRFAIQLSPGVVTTDVAEFEAALQSAEATGSDTERRQCLADAAELYGGPLLPGYYLDWIPTEQERLADHYVQALQSLTQVLEEAGEIEAALDHARRAVGVEPLREEGHRVLIRLLSAAGQPDAALRQYRELERILREELDESPSPATSRLVDQLLEAQEAAVVGEPPPSATAAERVTAPLPTGAVTFLLTEIEASRELEERAGAVFQEALAGCQTLLREHVRRHNGSEVTDAHGAFTVAFARPSDALLCAVACQQALAAHSWQEEANAVRVRMALDMGEPELRDGHYHGPVLDRATGLLLAAHGRQILCSDASAAVLRPALAPETRLADLGFYRLRTGSSPERLFSVNYPGMVPEDFPPPNAALAYTSNLPAQFTRFFGREEELARLQEMLLTEDTRLVTLTGPPGSGKTRLALECGQQLLETLDGAIWFVPLQALRESQLIAGAVVDALGLPRRPGPQPLDQIAEALSHQPSLLVLDNFEQLIEEGAGVVRDLLERVPSLTCLVTSRRGLDLTGESQFLLAPLPTPAGEEIPEELMRCASVQLFVDRAQAVRPDFQVTKASAPIISELCERLEGIPLALELAASRAQVLTPSHMLAQLRDRFDLLVSRKRDVGDRHRTLHAAVEWSYQLLPPPLQRFFARLSVFRGGWTVEAAEGVCEEPQALEYLTQLEECSLILIDEVAGEAGEVRFRMLETLREYSAELLSPQETVAVRQRHADYYITVSGYAWDRLWGYDGDQAAELRRVDGEHDNFRAALGWLKSTENGGERGLWLCYMLQQFWMIRGHHREGLRHLAELLAREDTAARTRRRIGALRIAGDMARLAEDSMAAQAFNAEALEIARELGHDGEVAAGHLELGLVASVQGDYSRARALSEESLAMSRELDDGPGKKTIMAISLSNLAEVAVREGDYATARPQFEEAVAILRELGERCRVALVLSSFGWMSVQQGDYAGARAPLEEALAISRELQVKVLIAQALHSLGELASAEGDHARAQVHFEESLAIGRELGSRRTIAVCLRGLGTLALAQGGLPGARSLLEESLQVGRGLGPLYETVPGLEALAAACVGEREDEQAARLLGAAEALREAMGTPLPPCDRPGQEGDVAAIRSRLDKGAFSAAWAEGRAMSWEEAVACALDGPRPKDRQSKPRSEQDSGQA